jgi:predicted  nucleic acid-binding Zn-ribbon protein
MAVKIKKDVTVEEKLRNLYTLQLIDSRIDAIRILRGELPLEIQDLKDEVEGLEVRIQKNEEQIKELKQTVTVRKNEDQEAKKIIKKSQEKQSNVKNNREYEALRQEIELATLNLQISDRKNKQADVEVAKKQEKSVELKALVKQKKDILNDKSKELDDIIAETEIEEQALLKLSKEVSQDIEDRLVKAYKRIRKSSINGLAVVPIDRDASAGSYILIPPQRQIEVALRARIIVDEHSGRILIDKELAESQKEVAEKLFKTALKK